MPNTANLAIVITVDDRGLVSIDNLGPRTQRSTRQAERSISSLSTAVKGLGALVATTLTFESIKNGVTQFASFEDQLLVTKAATGATADEFELLKQKALELGGEPAQSPAMVAEGMAELARSGQDVNDIMESVAANAQLAAGSELDFGQAAEFTTDILSQFGREASETQDLVDVLIAGANSASVTVTQMAESYKYAGAISDSMGISTNQTAASLLVLANSGIKASEGGTSLRAIWNKLLKKSDELSESYGVQIEEMRNGKVVTRELSDIIDDLSKVQLTAKERTKLFGQIAGPGMAVLLKKGGDAIREYESDLNNAAGTGERVSKTMQEGIGGALRTIGSDAQVAGLKIGEFFAPAVQSIADISFLAGRTVDALAGTFYKSAAGISAFAGTIFKLQGKIEGLTDKVGLTDAATNSWAEASTAAFESALDLSAKGSASFDMMLGKTKEVSAAQQKYKETLAQSKDTITADQEAQSARSDSVVGDIEKIAEAEKKVADEREKTVAEMYKTLGVGGEEYFRNEAQKLLDQAAKWEEAGADQIATQQYLYDEVTKLSEQAWTAQDQAAGIYLDGLTATFTSATSDIAADIEAVNAMAIDVSADIITDPFSAGVSEVDSEVDRLNKSDALVTIDGDNTGAMASLAEVTAGIADATSLLESAMGKIGGSGRVALNADALIGTVSGSTRLYRDAEGARQRGKETFSSRGHEYKTSDFYSFLTGGYTGHGQRKAPVDDGKGGFLAIMHDDEYVIPGNDYRSGKGQATNNTQSVTNQNTYIVNVTQPMTPAQIVNVSEQQKILVKRTVT